MTENLILDGFGSDLLVEQINASPTKKLIQELNFKYGLKVLTTTQLPEIYSTRPLEFVMCQPDTGFTAAKVWTIESAGEIEYNYRSPYYTKERGKNDSERETIHSKKLSSLMGTLKKNNVVADNDTIFNYQVMRAAFSIEKMVKDDFGSSYKSNPLNGEETHSLLKALISGNTSEINMQKCKELLDKYEKVDRMKAECIAEVDRFVSKELLMIGADKFDHLIVGTVKRVVKDPSREEYLYEIVKPFKRYRSAHQREDLIPLLTILKVHTEGKANEWYANFIPRMNERLDDLDMIAFSMSRGVSEYCCQWVATPC